MKSQDALRLSVLRMLLSEMNYKSIDLQRTLTDEDVVSVLQKEVKKRREAVDSYTAGGRAEQAAKEQQELDILSAYLPAMLSEEEIRKGLSRMPEVTPGAEFGQVMRIVSPHFKGKADGALVAKLVKELVSG